MNENKYVDSSNNLEQHHDDVNGSQQHFNKNEGYENTESNRRGCCQSKTLLIIIIAIIIIAAIVIPVAVVKGGQNNNDGDNNDGDNNDNEVGYCEENPQLCEGTTPEIQQYINEFTDPNEAQSALTFFKTMNSLNLKEPESYSQNFREIMKVSECIKTVMPNKSDEVFRVYVENQLKAEEDALAYLNMLGNFSGEPIQISNSEEVSDNCAEINSNVNSRLLQNSPPVCPTVDSNGNSILVYLYPIWITPNKLWDHLSELKKISSTHGFDTTVAFGAIIPENSANLLSILIAGFTEGVSLGGTLPQIQLSSLETLEFILYYVGMHGIESIPESKREKFTQFLINLKVILAAAYIDNSEYIMTQHIESFVKTQILRGRKVVLFSHAEGSVIAHKVFSSLSEREKATVGNFYVAPTINDLGPRITDYVLNSRDSVISTISENYNLLDMIILEPKGTAANFSSTVDFGFNHEFLGYLLANSEDISNEMTFYMIILNETTAVLNSGHITALIEWEDNTIQRLNIIEPDGTIVNSENKNGTVGQIDVTYNPTNESQKIEHYFVKCENTIAGVYNFSVSLENGTLPVAGRISITAGTEMFTKDFLLLNSNQQLASLNVRQRANGKLTFSILEIRSESSEGNETESEQNETESQNGTNESVSENMTEIPENTTETEQNSTNWEGQENQTNESEKIINETASEEETLQNETNETNSTNETVGICVSQPEICSGVEPEIVEMINQFDDPIQVQNILAVSNILNSLPNLTESTSKAEISDAYREMMKTSECMIASIPEKADEVFAGLVSAQLTSEEAVTNYLNLIGKFASEPIQNSSPEELADTCEGMSQNESTGNRRLQEGSACDSDHSDGDQVMIYLYPLGMSPPKLATHLNDLMRIVSYDYDFGATVALGANIPDSEENVLHRIIGDLIVERNGNETSMLRNLTVEEIREFTVLYIGVSSASSIAPAKRQKFLIVYRELKKRLAQFFQENPEYFDIDNILDFISTQILRGKKILLVSHGEGSHLAFKVLNSLTSVQKAEIGSLLIAPTVDSVGDGIAEYITNPNDLVISNITEESSIGILNLTVPLAANAEFTAFSLNQDFGLHHEFIGYLRAMDGIISTKIGDILDDLIQPNREIGSGPITVMISWDEQPDQDLHIYEPDGTHVFYNNFRGNVGHLDLDDTNGYGPEHYYTNCTLIVPGEYRFSVHFFRWNGGGVSNVRATITAGSQFFVKDMLFTQEKEEQNIGKVHVSVALSGRFVYEIERL